MNFTRYTQINLGIIFAIAIISAIIGFDVCTVTIMKWHGPEMDSFFKFYTQLAEWPIIVMALLLVFRRFRMAGLMLGLVFALQGLVVQGLKLWINRPRPFIRFPGEVREIKGLVLSHWNGFPSGHTAAAFFSVGLIIMSMHSKYRTIWFQVLCMTFAYLIGYSRVYLCQHSVEDVLVGALFASIFFYFAAYNLEKRTKRLSTI